jgi:homoserine O-succinyltransferase
MISAKRLRVALLDLYEGQANQGMRCIRELLADFARTHGIRPELDEFEVRIEQKLPDLSYDIYISSGGPGSPLDSINTAWEQAYFGWLNRIETHNRHAQPADRKQVLFICHSFQLICRHYDIAEVTSRRSTAFGVFPVHLLEGAEEEPVFNGLQDPFYAVDSRSFQVIQPNHQRIADMGGRVLAIEKERPHVPLERAIMAIRFNDSMIGTQFHPEADPTGMSIYLRRDDRKQIVIAEHGEEKWKSMVDHLEDPDKIRWTYSHVIPNFLTNAVEHSGILRPEPV